MAAAALMSSLGAVAATSDSFEASYIKDDEVTINILNDVALTDDDAVEDGDLQGSTPFYVGRTGAVEGGAVLGWAVTVDTANPLVDGVYQLQNGDASGKIGCQLYHTTDATFASTDQVTEVDNAIVGTTDLNIELCDARLQGTGYIHVNIPSANILGTYAGKYTDVVTMTVAPKS